MVPSWPSGKNLRQTCQAENVVEQIVGNHDLGMLTTVVFAWTMAASARFGSRAAAPERQPCAISRPPGPHWQAAGKPPRLSRELDPVAVVDANFNLDNPIPAMEPQLRACSQLRRVARP